MIGRFLLGAGLGGLVGTGLLALASVTGPAPGARGPVAATEGPVVPAEAPPAEAAPPAPPAPDAAAKTDSPAATPVPDASSAGTAAETAAETAPQTPPAEGASDATGPVAEAGPAAEAEPEAEPETAPETAPEAAADAAPPAAATDAPAALAEAPDAPDAPAGTALPAAEPPALASADPGAPLAPVTEPGPVAAALPAPAPSVTDAVAPDAPQGAGTAMAAAEAPVAGDGLPVTGPGPQSPAPPAADPAPAPDAPPLPPLSPEEEAMLAEIAARGEEAIPDPAALPPAPVETAPAETSPEPLPTEPDPEAAPVPPVLPPPSEGSLIDDEDRRLALGDGGSTLPPTPPLAGKSDAPAPEAAILPADDRPLVAHARPFDPQEGRPLFSVILIDGGEATLDRAALAAMPFPVTFAIDPLAKDAADHARLYRDAGQEVVMLATGLPSGAEATDVEQAFQAMAQVLPQAVAVMDLPDPAFQADRPLATLVVPVVGAQGRGLVTWDRGLNAADQVARREDVPAAVVFRDLDAEGEEAPVIRRYLDRAAFKAAQEGRVTVVGRARPETVTALLEWAVEGRADTVALAPLTAVLSID